MKFRMLLWDKLKCILSRVKCRAHKCENRAVSGYKCECGIVKYVCNDHQASKKQLIRSCIYTSKCIKCMEKTLWSSRMFLKIKSSDRSAVFFVCDHCIFNVMVLSSRPSGQDTEWNSEFPKAYATCSRFCTALL